MTPIHTAHEEACPEIGPICAIRDEPPQLHDQHLLAGELRLDAEYGFASGWSAGVVVNLRALRTRVRYLDPDGNPKALDYENIHHRNQTIIGPGDPWLMVRHGVRVSPWDLGISARLGATLPIGFTVDDPFALAEQGLPHEHAQFGTGTVNAIVGLELKKEFHVPFNGSVSAYGLGVLVPAANPRGYQAGHRLTGGVSLAGKVGFKGPILRAGALWFRETPERWASTPMAQEGNLGRTDVLLDLGAVFRLGGDWSGAISVRIPVYTRLSGGAQLTYPGTGELGISRLVHVHQGPEGVD